MDRDTIVTAVFRCGQDNSSQSADGYLWCVAEREGFVFPIFNLYKLTLSGGIAASYATPHGYDMLNGGPEGLAWDGTYLWHADSGKDQILQLNNRGTEIASFSAPSNSMTDLAWDGAFLWAADVMSGVVYKLTTAGVVVDSFPGPGSSPRGLTWDGANLWLADGNAMIYKLTTTGAILGSFPSPGGDPYGLAFDGTYLWNCDRGSAKLYRLTTGGTVVGSFSICGDPTPKPRGLAWSP